MDIHLLETTDWMAHFIWVAGYGLVLTALLARAVWLSSNGQHVQAILIAQLVALGSFAPLGSWLIPSLGGPWIFATFLVALMLLSIMRTLMGFSKTARIGSQSSR